ncbi:MAG: hypothetical protein JSU81_04350 [Candidatus Coatesbacteria bacterium]|nr:MAG: hypothetical protein JSU81_04350 [Candidatus Coatesbacteria bacterium]
MNRYLAVFLSVAIIIPAAGCERLKLFSEEETAPEAETVAAPAPEEKPAEKPVGAPNKEEYYRMLRAGYEPPRRTVRSGGYLGSGTPRPERRTLSEKEGEGLKWKYGEGRKFAASGRGEEPKIPEYIDHDDGTNPPREYRGDD